MAPLAQQSLLLDVAVAGERLAAVGERGHILISTDAGAHWRQVPSPVRATLTGVYLQSGTLGWVVGHDETILRTRDGGETWELVHFVPENEQPLLDVWFATPQHGLAVGAYGLLLETNDGGDTWARRGVSEDDFHLNHITQSGSGALFIAAEAGNLYRSDDLGDSWTALPSPYSGSLFATVPLPNDAVLLLGLRGHLHRSPDNGETWRTIESHTEAMLTGGTVLANGTVVLTGLGGTVLVSQDHGQSFRLIQNADRKGIMATVETTAGKRVEVGEFGVRVVNQP